MSFTVHLRCCFAGGRALTKGDCIPKRAVCLSSCVVVLLAAVRRQRGDCIPKQSIDACAAFVRPVAAVRLPRQSIDAVQRLFTNYFASAGPRPNEK